MQLLKKSLSSLSNKSIKNENLIIASTVLIALSSCTKVLDGTSGPIMTESRVVTDFNTMNIQGHIDVIYTQDSVNVLSIEAGENMLQYIHADVVNGQLLVFESSNSIANHKRITVIVSSDSLNSVELEGAGDFDADQINVTNFSSSSIGSGNINVQINCNALNVHSTGSGDVELVGTSDLLTIENTGSGDIKARFLNANDVFVDIVGSGDATVHADSLLDASLTGSGDIYYYGNPTATQVSDTGSGDVIQKN